MPRQMALVCLGFLLQELDDGSWLLSVARNWVSLIKITYFCLNTRLTVPGPRCVGRRARQLSFSRIQIKINDGFPKIAAFHVLREIEINFGKSEQIMRFTRQYRNFYLVFGLIFAPKLIYFLNIFDKICFFRL